MFDLTIIQTVLKFYLDFNLLISQMIVKNCP